MTLPSYTSRTYLDHDIKILEARIKALELRLKQVEEWQRWRDFMRFGAGPK